MINTQLKKAIIDFIFENKDIRNRRNAISKKFHNYLYDENGNFLIGGKKLSDWIDEIDKLI